jgi:GAF domain-containing protein
VKRLFVTKSENNMTASIKRLAAALQEPGQPSRLFEAIEAETQSLVGHRLFTVLYVDGQDVARIYSSNAAAYPVSGRKPMGPTPWGAHVLAGKRPYLGQDAAAIRWAFFDHVLIASLGLGSVINIPVIYDGRAIGTMNLLDAEHHYQEAHVSLVAGLTFALIPALLDARTQTK